MSFLIAEILGLLLLAALCGGALTNWWLRRNFVDVSSEYTRYERTLTEVERLRDHKADGDTRIAALEAEKAQLDTRLADELTFRGSIEPNLESLEKRVATLRNTDVSKIEAGVTATSAAIAELKSPDLRPVETKLDSIGKRVAALRNADVSTVDAHVRGLTESVARVDARLAALPAAPDLSRVHQRLDAIEQALRARPVPAPQPRAKREPVESMPKARAAQPRRPRAGALLASPTFGKADDLKSISGIGPKLEKMLNDIGVYYFFQVSAWNKTDVKRVDDLLEAFPGRIERDGWVDQASELARRPGAATMSRPKAAMKAQSSEVASVQGFVAEQPDRP